MRLDGCLVCWLGFDRFFSSLVSHGFIARRGMFRVGAISVVGVRDYWRHRRFDGYLVSWLGLGHFFPGLVGHGFVA